MPNVSQDLEFQKSWTSNRTAGRRVPFVVPTDGERLMRFRQHRDEAAFHEVVRAHAPLVWGICWQVLRHREDVEDAFQATFLILARKASAIRAADSAAGWLYRVAFRTALAARQRRRRQGAEPLVADPPGSLEDQLASIERSEQCEALLEELHTLAGRYRQPLVLCYLEGRSRQEAADELGVTLASVKGRLARGLRLLRTRLAHRGTALSSAAALLAAEMSAASASAATAPVAEAAALGTMFACQATSASGPNSAASGAVTLAKKGIVAMKIAAVAKPAIGLLALGMTAGALALGAADQPGSGGGGSSTGVVELVAGDILAPATDLPAAPSEASEPVAQASELAPPSEATEIPSADVLMPVAQVAPATPAEPTSPVESVPPTEASPPVADLPQLSDPPADVLIPAPPGALPTENGQPVIVRDQLIVDDVTRQVPVPQRAPFSYQRAETVLDAPVPSSREVMGLEMEYWQLKANGLKKKAAALHAKVRAEGVSQIESLEADAESELTLAEVKLCEARQQQLKEALSRPEPAALGEISPDNPDGFPNRGPMARRNSRPAKPARMAPPAPAMTPQLAAPAAEPTPAYSAAADAAPTAPLAAPQSPTFAVEPDAAYANDPSAELQKSTAKLRRQVAELMNAIAQQQREIDRLKRSGARP